MKIPKLENILYNIIMYIYHPKIRKFTKLFVNDYYKEILCNDNEYYYDIIIKGLTLMKGCSNSQSDNNKFKKLLNYKNDNHETNIKVLQLKCGIPILFYEEKCINNDKPISILFLGTNKNTCLFVKIIDNNAYLENLSTEINNTNNIEKIMYFLKNYCMNNGVKNIITFKK